MNKLTALAEEMKYDSSGYAKAIIELCALLEQAEEALEETTALCTNYEAVEEPDGYQFTEAPAVIKQGQEAIAAIKKWREGT